MPRFSFRSGVGEPQTPPDLSVFEISPSIGVRGTKIILTWQASGHHTLIVTTPSGRKLNPAATSESVDLALERSGTFQLAALNDYGTAVATFEVMMIDLPDLSIPDPPRFADVVGLASTITGRERGAVMEVSDGYRLAGELLTVAPVSKPGPLPSIDEVTAPRGSTVRTGVRSPYDVVDSAVRDASV